ncbi:MAG: MarR family transcriptional regulator [Fimbriimonadales bacterium]|jgi:DNA-binding MarR family transcriptional regulator
MVGKVNPANAPDTAVVAERIRAAWRDLRRAGSTGPVRAYLYDPDAPLDIAQADALDLIVTNAPVRMSEVAALLRVDPSTATRTVAKLQERTLVVREPDPDDARAILVTPSPAGAELHRRVRSRANELLIETLDAFSGPDRELLADLLERLVEAVDEARFVRGLRPSQTSP